MGIQEDIFEEFFKKLGDDKEVPNVIVEGLKKLRETGDISQENILEALKRGCTDASKD